MIAKLITIFAVAGVLIPLDSIAQTAFSVANVPGYPGASISDEMGALQIGVKVSLGGYDYAENTALDSYLFLSIRVETEYHGLGFAAGR